MGGVWQRLSTIRRPSKQIVHPRWDSSSKARTAPTSYPRPLTARQKLANEIKDRSLYRALLREATYFPDEYTRLYVHDRVKTRFQLYHSNAREQLDPSYQIRLTRVRATARKAFNLLRRANAGESAALVSVLHLAYGRRGSRRRQLLNEIRNLDQIEQPTSVNAQPATRAAHWINYTAGLTPRLQALAVAQKLTTLKTRGVNIKLNLSMLEPQVPELNSWRRPTPLRRVKRITERWYADLLSRIMPPLSTPDWLRLYELARGKREVQIPRQRSNAIKKTVNPLDEVITSRNGRLQLSSNRHGRPRTRAKDLDRGVKPRTLRRAFEEVFMLCPHLYQDGEWKVVSGAVALVRPGIADYIRAKHQ